MIPTSLLLLIGIFGFYLWNLSRSLKKAQNQIRAAFIQVDLELQKRNARIPEFIEISKKNLAQERPLLESLVQKRNEASAALQRATIHPFDQEIMNSLCLKEMEFQKVLTLFINLLSTQEKLLTQPPLIELLQTEKNSQHQIRTTIESYNQSISQYNLAQEPFPAFILCSFLGFHKAPLLLVS